MSVELRYAGTHSGLQQGVHLILHQRDERRDDDRDAVTQQGGDLVAQRLAAAGGHDHQGVAVAGHVIDDRFLFAPKRVVSEHAFENVVRRAVHGA